MFLIVNQIKASPISNAVPKVEFLPPTDMDSGKKDHLINAIASAESAGKKEQFKATFIVEKLRSEIGGFWSAFAFRAGFWAYYPQPGTIAFFKYDSNYWVVFQHRK